MNENKKCLDSISIIDIANEFVRKQPARQNIFGNFTEHDLWRFKKEKNNSLLSVAI